MSERIFEFANDTIRYEIPVVFGEPRQPSRLEVRPGRRLYLTADGSRLVEQGDPEAASLYCTENSVVRRDEFERLIGKEMADVESIV